MLDVENKKDTTLILNNGAVIKNVNFSALSKWYYYPENLELAYNNNFISFDFIGIKINKSSRVKYKYMLEGFDKNWSSITSKSEATYTNLSHGNYTFKVQAVNSDGYWSNEFSYSFIINPPWWFTWWAYLIYGIFVIILVMFTHRILQKRLIEKEHQKSQKKELAQAKEIEKAYSNLKATQSQLIQSEKMASLGELTAGIAHEIQNPLNFVNNFSEVSKELIVEMNEEIANKNFDEVEDISQDIDNNLEKINHHGKRAEAIVKGMLQHSRTSSGERELTDVNTLADEYLRLSYHGLRAKDKSFNADFKLEADKSLPKINVVPQDIGRVLLNLINNAFYAVDKRAKATPQPPKGGVKNVPNKYRPTVTISTQFLKSPSGDLGVKINVTDNGPGIPPEIKDKIFQPFFTTKPTGSGTGLGLSLSYDIIKAHGGEISVKTNKNKGSQFIIQLPQN